MTVVGPFLWAVFFYAPWERRGFIRSDADKALDQNRPADAVTALASVHPGKYSDSREAIVLLRAKAIDAAGNTMDAFDSLLVFYIREPSDESHHIMLAYAAKMGKDATWVDEAVKGRGMAAAKEAPAFDLCAYQTGHSISLKDYRGKVVLLTFEFPGCRPCRGEFPHFQEVVNKFKGRDIAYIGINMTQNQDPYVLPFMQSSEYSFTPAS